MANTVKYLSHDGLRHYTEKILQIIEDNEYVTAAALTKLSDDVRNLTTITNSSSTNMVYLLGAPAINANTPIHTNSGVYMNGGSLYALSDEREKDFTGDLEVDFAKLKMIPKKYFTWKDDETKKLNIGTSAQELNKLYPELVTYNEDKNLYGVDYNKLSIVALAAVDKLYNENQELKERLARIEERLGI